MKIPYIIKFDNFKIRPLLVREEVLAYALRVIALNYDEIKAHQTRDLNERQFFYRTTDKTPKEQAFMKALYEQGFLNSVATVVYTFEELNNLKTLTPKAFWPQFDEIKIYFNSDSYQPTKIRGGFSDQQAHILNEIPYEKENVVKSVFTRYLDIANSVGAFDRKGTNFSQDLKEKAQSSLGPGSTFNFSEKFLEHMCDLVSESFSHWTSPYSFGIYQPDKAEAILLQFVATVQDNIKKNLNVLTDPALKNTYSYGIQSKEYMLNPTANIGPILWNALHEAYPSLAIQVEKQKLKSFEALQIKPTEDTNVILKKRSTQKI